MSILFLKYVITFLFSSNTKHNKKPWSKSSVNILPPIETHQKVSYLYVYTIYIYIHVYFIYTMIKSEPGGGPKIVRHASIGFYTVLLQINALYYVYYINILTQ